MKHPKQLAGCCRLIHTIHWHRPHSLSAQPVVVLFVHAMNVELNAPEVNNDFLSIAIDSGAHPRHTLCMEQEKLSTDKTSAQTVRTNSCTDESSPTIGHVRTNPKEPYENRANSQSLS